ncbi:MAG TPA: hypothetical protein VG276_31345 [Actinomycetes bacterium]|jgi:hypothetical protein|nr:hypothetical protein [Actinomycetes bacterium]
MTSRELERALVELGAHLEHPTTPPIAEAVAARLSEAPARSPRARGAAGAGRAWDWVRAWRRRPFPRPRWQRLALAGLAVVLLAAAVLAASPATREAAARLLGLRGVRIVIGGHGPTGTTGTGSELYLGEPATLAEARQRVRFPVVVPTAPGFERPDAVYVDPSVPADGRVDLVYRPRPGLPAAPGTGVGLLVTQFRASVDEGFLKKVQFGEGSLELVTVNGQPGYWFPTEHGFSYLDRNGNEMPETSRLAGSTLLWERGDLTLRLEGQVSREEALRIAESMR